MSSAYFVSYINSYAGKKTFTSEANTMNPDQTAPKGAVWSWFMLFAIYATLKDSETWLKRPLKIRQNKGLKDWLSINAGQKYCRILQYFWPALAITLSDNCSWKPISDLLLSGRLRQVLL